MSYSLDTNACIALMNGKNSAIRRKFDHAVAVNESIHLSSVVFFELWYGAENSSRISENLSRLTQFVTGWIQLLPFERDDAQMAGKLRRDLKAIGLPIGPYDLLIAAQTMSHGLTLVTHNVREFGRIPGLTIEDWEA